MAEETEAQLEKKLLDLITSVANLRSEEIWSGDDEDLSVALSGMLVYEYLANGGEKRMGVFYLEDMTPWQVLGLMEGAKLVETAGFNTVWEDEEDG